jgi:hypothetical protein
MATTTPRGRAGKLDGEGPDRTITETARQVADSVAGAAGEVTARLPEAASTTRGVLDEANRMVRAGSDETRNIVGAFSLGFAGGLLVGGAPRLVIAAALLPAAFIGMHYVERMNQPGRRSVQGA